MLKKSEHRNIINKELLYQNKVNSFAPRNCKNGLPQGNVGKQDKVALQKRYISLMHKAN